MRMTIPKNRLISGIIGGLPACYDQVFRTSASSSSCSVFTHRTQASAVSAEAGMHRAACRYSSSAKGSVGTSVNLRQLHCRCGVGFHPAGRRTESEECPQGLELLLLGAGLEFPRRAERTKRVDVELLQSRPASRCGERQQLLLEEMAVLPTDVAFNSRDSASTRNLSMASPTDGISLRR